jgi:uncharacterized membrane protein YuzA (DUF378 family)
MSDDSPAATDSASDTDTESYGGVLGTFPYAFRQSSSRLFQSYVVLGGVVAALVAVVFLFALIQLIARTVGTTGGTFSFVRAFYILVGMAVVVPLIAPVLLVARRYRQSESAAAYDRALAASGYLFIISLYLALVITAPPELRETPSGASAPVVEALYSLPPIAGAVPPLVVVAIGYALHRRLR